jgi:hypothetical protein
LHGELNVQAKNVIKQTSIPDISNNPNPLLPGKRLNFSPSLLISVVMVRGYEGLKSEGSGVGVLKELNGGGRGTKRFLDN